MWIFFLVVALCLGGAAGLHWALEAHLFGYAGFASFAHELEMALLVSFFLTISVEVLSRSHHRSIANKINENVFRATLQRNLPTSIYQELERSILLAKVYRENYELEMVITSVTADMAHLAATCCYELVNMTGASVDHDALLKIDLNVKDPARCRITEVLIDGKPLTAKEKKKSLRRTGSYETFKMPVKLKGNGRRRLQFKYETVGDLQGAEAVCCVTPSTNLTLKVVTPSKDFDLTVETLHMSDAKHVKDGPHLHEWRIEEALLPCQGLQLQWKKRQPSPTPDAKKAASPTIVNLHQKAG